MPDQARPVTVLYFYKTRWGSHDLFVELFERNHLPILEAQVESGRLLDVRRYVPHFHGEGRADWDVLVTITYRDWAALESGSDADIAERLFPDQATYRKEERRRYELLEAHWDVPLDERADRAPAGGR
ncbi:MAG: hypothetical protein E6J17_06365 [Chloroflexi bacterium]|nr:MAG: hypothetical protein E6J17_06365 [Chloroflexota bacterium]